jgi:hypothetical protein
MAFARKLKPLRSITRDAHGSLELDALHQHDIEPCYAGHSGLPEATDSLALEPVQRLLAVIALGSLLRLQQDS